jgi:mannosyltransferase
VRATPSDTRSAPQHDARPPVDIRAEQPVVGPTVDADRDGGHARRWRWPSWLAVEVRDDGPLPAALVAVVAATVVAGVVLRFVTRSHLWLDEALSADIAALPLGEIPGALRHDGHPPLYYALLHVWSAVVGSGDVAVRALSGFLSVLTLPFAYAAGRRAGGRLLGLLTLAVFALSPFALRYATETRMYALVTLLVVLGYLLVDDIARRDRSGPLPLAGLALVTAALLWSHYWSLWLVGGTALVLLWGWRRAAAPAVARGSGRALGALVAGGVLFLPWLPSMLYQAAHTGTPWAGPVRPTTLLAITLTDFGGGAVADTFHEPELLGGVMLVLVALALFGAARSAHRIDLDLRTVPQFRAEAAVVATTLVLAMAAMYATRSAFASRYASTLLPLVLLLVAGGLSRLRDLRVLGGGLAVVLALSAVGAAYNVRTDRTQAAKVADQVAARARPGDVVLYCPDQVAPAALRLMPPGLEHVTFPRLPGDAWPVDRVDWVDYRNRNAVDVGTYARAIAAHAPDRQLFVMFSGTYKTHQGVCEDLVNKLSAERGSPEILVGADGVTYFESAGLAAFGPRPAG